MGIQPIRKTVVPEIPDKLYFRIGDVARLCEVPAYVLRFWETEFPQLKPNKGGTGQRLYRRKDVEMALRIKSLLYDQGYTIPGARQAFKNEAAKAEPRADARLEARAGREAVATTALPPPAAHSEVASAGFSEAFLPEAAGETAGPAATASGDRLRHLRAELVSLLDVLSQPPGVGAEGSARRLRAVSPGAAQPIPMRPRLVAERARPEMVERPETQPLRLVPHPARADFQGDLFGIVRPDGE